MKEHIDSPYSDMTVPELKKEAKKKGYKGIYKLRKPELIHLLETGEMLDIAGRLEGASVFEPEEVKDISESFSGKYATRDKTVFLLGLCIGSRVSELAQLKVKDVWRNGKPLKTIVIRAETAKRKKARRIPIDVNPIACEIISEFIQWKNKQGESLEPSAPLFVSQKGGHLSRMQIHRILKRTYKAAGIETDRASTHSMRKTAATWLYEATKDIKCVQNFLGHSDSTTTEQYINLAFRVVREGVAQLSERLKYAVSEDEKNVTKCEKLLHFDSDEITITKERYYRLLEIESQYEEMKQETRRLHQLLEEIIQKFDDNPSFKKDGKVISLKDYLEERSA